MDFMGIFPLKKEVVRFCRSDSILSFVTSENSSQTKPGKKYFSGNVKTALLVYFFKILMQNSGDTSLNKIEYAVTKFRTNRHLVLSALRFLFLPALKKLYFRELC